MGIEGIIDIATCTTTDFQVAAREAGGDEVVTYHEGGSRCSAYTLHIHIIVRAGSEAGEPVGVLAGGVGDTVHRYIIIDGVTAGVARTNTPVKQCRGACHMGYM